MMGIIARAGPSLLFIGLMLFCFSASAHDVITAKSNEPAAEIVAPVPLVGHAILVASSPVAAQKTLGADIAQHEYTEPARVVDAAEPHIMEQAVLACSRPETSGNLYGMIHDGASSTTAYDNAKRGQPQKGVMAISACTRPGDTPASDRDAPADIVAGIDDHQPQPRQILIC